MRTAIVSDLHLGTTVARADVAALPEALERLVEALSGADQVILLGDLLELRERPLVDVLEAARPVVERLGEVTAGRRVVIVPGNHDHQLGEPWLARERLAGRSLGAESEWPVGRGDGIAGRLAEWMPRTELSVAYPGVRPRADVWAAHGHYLDAHMTVPRLESIAASLMGRVTGRGRRCQSADDYELALGPLYALLYGVAQGASSGALQSGSTASRTVWQAVNGGGRMPALLLGRVTIPAAVAVLNRAGLGPFRPDISSPELRSAGLRAMREVVAALGVEAEHVVFGHTHRAGPLAGDAPEEWARASGGRLWNSGSWLYDDAFLSGARRDSPYWPGTVLTLDDTGPPRLRNVLRDLALAVA